MINQFLETSAKFFRNLETTRLNAQNNPKLGKLAISNLFIVKLIFYGKRKKQRCIHLMNTFPRILFVALFSIMSTVAFAQSKTVTGVVIDNLGEPIIGASVVVDGTSNGTITDIDGRFSLSNVPNDGNLKISYIGYITQNVSVAGKNMMNITLKEDAQALDEVVVVGYGTVKKSDVTGALTQVSERTIKERPVQNALQAMQGKAAGVNVTTNSRPGELGEVRIRGNRSITADNDPLYVIDGIPLSAGSLADINPNDIATMEVLKDASATAIYGSRGANGVILVTTKRGKTGKTTINYDGSVTFSKIHSQTDWMNSGQLIDWNRQKMINADSYTGKYGNAPDPAADTGLFGDPYLYSYMMPVFKSAFQLNDDGTPVLRAATPYEMDELGYASQVPVYNSANIPTTPWTDYVTRTGITHNHQISLSAGSENSNLYMSFAYLDQESPMVDQYYERYTVNLNGEIKPTKWLKVGMGINASHAIRDYGMVQNTSNTVAKDSYGLATNLMPYAPAYDENGNVLITTERESVSAHNVLRNINQSTHEYRYYSAMLSSYAEAQILPWLKWRTNFGVQYRNTRQGSFYGENFTNPYGYESTQPGVAYDNHSQNLSWTLENLIYADKTFNDIHTVGVTLLQSAEKYRTEGLNVRAYDVVFPTSMWYNIGASDTSKSSIGSAFSTWSRASYVARINYSLMNRYLLTATGRWDGASVLASGSKWDFFPSLALAWKMEEESFIRNIPWIDQLKLRVGYGITGNSAIKPYQTTGTMSSTYANIAFGAGNVSSHTTGAKAVILPNSGLGWEKTASTNIGLDFGLLNHRISGSIEYYIANTSDLLLNRTIPIQTGYTSILSNISKTRNRGVEITLTGIPIQTRDFQWKLDLTFSTNKEEIKELANGKEDDPTNGWFIGKPVSEIWSWKYDRLWQDTPEDQRMMSVYKDAGSLTFIPGQAKLVDQPFIEVPEGTEGSTTVTLKSGEKVTYMDNGFGKFNDDDKHFLGSTRPDWEGGLTTTFTYKNWQLNAFIYARIGGMYYGLLQTYGRRVEKDVWSPTNTGGKYPQPRSGGEAFTDYSSYMNWSKANMISIRNIALSYNVPDKYLRKLGATSCQIYGQVLNPFIFGGDLVKEGINPDDMTGWANKSAQVVSTIGGQTNNTILTRSYVIGLRFGF